MAKPWVASGASQPEGLLGVKAPCLDGFNASLAPATLTSTKHALFTRPVSLGTRVVTTVTAYRTADHVPFILPSDHGGRW